MLNKNTKIVITDTKKDEEFLHEKTKSFDFSAHSQKEINELVRNMRIIMHKANGIGLSANQVGLSWRMFVAEVPSEHGSKFYAIFNPEIVNREGTALKEEGCLSIPGTHGEVERSERIVLKGQDKHGKPIEITAWGILAHVFEHEVDHLDGTLFTDIAEETYALEN